jgi:hypothetical protein
LGSPAIFNGNYVKFLKSALRPGSLTADPLLPQTGDIYYNSTAGQYRYYNGTSWIVIGAATPVAAIAARYVNSATSVTGSDTTVTYSTLDYDTNTAYSSGTYTVPALGQGQYQINASLLLSGTFVVNNQSAISVYVNGSQKSERLVYAAASVTNVLLVLADTLQLNAGDLVTIRVRSGATSPAIVSSSVENAFSIAKIAASNNSGTSWVNAGTNTFTATTTAPTKGTTTTDEVWWRRVGDSMECRISYVQTASGTNGNGTYLFQIPSGYSIDTTKLTAYSTDNLEVPSTGTSISNMVGSVIAGESDSGQAISGGVIVYDSIRVQTWGVYGNGGAIQRGSICHNLIQLGVTHCAINMVFTVPIVGWS